MVDYRKWDKIEVSDDENDTHPNIDTASLYRWRHQARVQRMAEMEEKSKSLEMRKKQCCDELDALNQRIDSFKSTCPNTELADHFKMENEKIHEIVGITYLTKMKELEEESKALIKEKQSQPLNVDTLSKECNSRTIINTPVVVDTDKSDQDVVDNLKQFIDEHKKEAKHYAMLSKPSDSSEYLTEHPYLASEEAANYLCLWCIDLAVEKKTSLLDRVSQQTIYLQFLLEIAKTYKSHPRQMITSFFSKLNVMGAEYTQSMNSELIQFKQRVYGRAEARIEEARREVEEENKKQRLGPGGLDPLEVLETLPANLKEAFEQRDYEILTKVIMELPGEEAEYHIKRCVDSGLWVPDSKSDADDEIKDEDN